VVSIRITLAEPPWVHAFLTPVSFQAISPLFVCNTVAGMDILPFLCEFSIYGIQITHSYEIALAMFLDIESHTEITDGILMKSRLRAVSAIHNILLCSIREPTFYLKETVLRTAERQTFNRMSKTSFSRFFHIRSRYRSGRQFKAESAGHRSMCSRITICGRAQHDRRPLVFADQCLRHIEIRVFSKVRHQSHPSVESGVEHIIRQDSLKRLESALQQNFIYTHLL